MKTQIDLQELATREDIHPLILKAFGWSNEVIATKLGVCARTIEAYGASENATMRRNPSMKVRMLAAERLKRSLQEKTEFKYPELIVRYLD